MSGIGSAVSEIFGGIGDFASASGYREGAKYAGQNAQIEKLSGQIQENQATRQIYQTIGGGIADVGASGVTESGSAMDVLRSSVQQGGLQKSLIANQSLINQNSWLEKQSEDTASAEAKQAEGAGGVIGGILGIFGL